VTGACGSIASVADCLDPAKVDFSKVALTDEFAFTTETATGTLTEATQGGTSTLTRIGVAFDCCNWTSSSPATVLLPAPNEDTNVLGTIKDTVNLFQLAE
jgi:hypothetical protein